jgi:hypothetical protein
MEKLIERGSIRHGGIDAAVEAILANKNAIKPVETIVLSSTHRIGEQVSEKLHEAYRAVMPEIRLASISAFRVKQLRPAELLSTASYKPGEMIEYHPNQKKAVRMAEVVAVCAEGIRVKGQQEPIAFDRVSAAYATATLERGAGEMLLLTQKIKQKGKVYENGSRQTIAAIDGGKMRFESGLVLDLQDGRVRQGDAVTTYKAQGASRTEMIRVEDNRSFLAMANREDLHVAFTRHRATARMFVQDVDMLRKAAHRSLIDKVAARDLQQETHGAERQIGAIVNQLRATIKAQIREISRKAATAMDRRRDLIFELSLRKRRAKSLAAERNRSQGFSI